MKGAGNWAGFVSLLWWRHTDVGGTEAIRALSRLATHLSTRQGHPKSLVCNEIYGRLNLALVRANSRAILSRSLCIMRTV